MLQVDTLFNFHLITDQGQLCICSGCLRGCESEVINSC